jgi:hypothetical protein
VAGSHSFFIEDGVEMYNRIEGNLAVNTHASNSLLNTDQVKGDARTHSLSAGWGGGGGVIWIAWDRV